ncbi:MAG: hypothetical protein A6D91_04295 [Bacillaceae bacterium G1]|nr:sterol-binding protein [Bacillota bacterium]OJF17157.1 MAG: hypothetical protein A6D91_04295 [Bacillaceae bacterium G1]
MTAKPSMQTVFQMIDAALKSKPELAQGSEGVYQFDLTGEGGGTFQIIIDDQGPRAVSGTEKEADCTLVLDTEDFRQLLAGKLNATEAFMSGQLAIHGDLGVALRLQGLLSVYTF